MEGQAKQLGGRWAHHVSTNGLLTTAGFRDRGDAARGLSGRDRSDVFSMVERIDCIMLSGDCGGDLLRSVLRGPYRGLREA